MQNTNLDMDRLIEVSHNGTWGFRFGQISAVRKRMVQRYWHYEGVGVSIVQPPEHLTSLKHTWWFSHRADNNPFSLSQDSNFMPSVIKNNIKYNVHTY